MMNAWLVVLRVAPWLFADWGCFTINLPPGTVRPTHNL